MKLLNFLRKYTLSKKTIFNSIVFLLLVYFIFHSIYGDKGIIAYFKLNQKLVKSNEELEDLRAERVEIEHKGKLLRLESLDKDMLDEHARNNLGIASPNEQIFTTEKKKP
jgi:cell division protein FtsB